MQNDKIVIEYGMGKKEGVELDRAYDKDSNLKYIKCRFNITTDQGVFKRIPVTETLEKWVDIKYIGWIK